MNRSNGGTTIVGIMSTQNVNKTIMRLVITKINPTTNALLVGVVQSNIHTYVYIYRRDLPLPWNLHPLIASHQLLPIIIIVIKIFPEGTTTTTTSTKI